MLGCAWMERAVLTDSTLKRKGRQPWKVSFTLAPRQAGLSAIHWPSVFWGMRLSRMRASPRGCAPIHSCGRQTDRWTCELTANFSPGCLAVNVAKGCPWGAESRWAPLLLPGLQGTGRGPASLPASEW